MARRTLAPCGDAEGEGMPTLERYDPPGCLGDFDAISGQRDAWDAYLRQLFAIAVAKTKLDLPAPGEPLFYSAIGQRIGEIDAVDIGWTAFPRELLSRFGRARALVEADRVWPLAAYDLDWRFDPDLPWPRNDLAAESVDGNTGSVFYHPTTEYCEWHVDRDPQTGRARRICFTCEPPEYWQALFGDQPVLFDGTTPAPETFPGDRSLVLELYRQHVGDRVRMEDLELQQDLTCFLGLLKKGGYNPFNRWNTTHGIMHMTAPPNMLPAEIMLAARSTLLFDENRLATDGAPVAARMPELLVAAGELGNANRASDTTIVGQVNALARAGRRLTLANPVGLYMDHVDTAGWELPGGLVPADCLHAKRGRGHRICRLEVKMPTDEFDLGDLRIGGEPVLHGGQVAECIVVKLAAESPRRKQPAGRLGARLPGGCRISADAGMELFGSGRGVPAPPAAIEAFLQQSPPPAHAAHAYGRKR
jgi:hypothetical protein